MHRTIYAAVVVLSLVAACWSYGWYSATSAVFSDLPAYGIPYGGEAHRGMVAIARKQLRLVAAPLAAMLIVALVGWGVCLRQLTRVRRQLADSSSR
jgi:hypothetical protein